MRWVFVLLVVLNGFYFAWSQLEAPVRPKEFAGVSAGVAQGKDIRLLAETAGAPSSAQRCLYLGGFAGRETVVALKARLDSAQVNSRIAEFVGDPQARWWLQLAQRSGAVIDERVTESLAKEFKDLKRQTFPCEGVATVE